MTTIEAHIALMLASLANLVGIAVGVRQLRRLRRKINGHLHTHDDQP